MSIPGASGRSTGLLSLSIVAFLSTLFTAAGPARAFGGTVTVDLLASPHSRLAEDLRRELAASDFVVVFVEATGGDWRADVRRLPGSQARRGVVVRPDERLMTVFTRIASSDIIETHLDQQVDPGDRMARRRACLGVVEYLRVLADNESPPLGGTARGPGGSPPAAATTGISNHPAALTPSQAAPAPPAPLSAAPSAIPADGQRQRAVVPGAALPGVPLQMGASSPGGGGGPAAAATGAGEQPGAAAPATELSVPQVAGNPPDVTLRESPPLIARRRKPWQVGVGSTWGLAAAPGGPTGHLQFLWYLPLESRLAVCARVLWPVLGGQFRSAGNDVRTWIFGGALSLHYLIDVGPSRLRPFVGAALGTRVALTETTAATALQSRETFTPSLTFGAEVGVRYDLAPPVQLFFEVGVARGWLLPGVHRVDYEQEAANAEALQASFGVSFEI